MKEVERSKSMIKIDKNIPIYEGNRGKKRKYPFSEMEIGDSFAIPCDEMKECHRIQCTIVSSSYRNKKVKGRMFTTRVSLANKEVRCWRIE